MKSSLSSTMSLGIVEQGMNSIGQFTIPRFDKYQSAQLIDEIHTTYDLVHLYPFFLQLPL